MDTNDQKQTAKQRVLQAQGKDVAVDLFLYSCLERERLVKAKEGTGFETISWPELAVGPDGEAPVDKDDMALSGLVMRMITWYRDTFPEMTDRGALDHRQLVLVVPPVVGLNMDLNALYRRKTGDDLPPYEASVGNNKIWDEVLRAIADKFPSYQRFFVRYIQWSHATEPVEVVDPSNRPPVGRYAPRLPRPGDRDRPPRGGDRPPRGNFEDRPPRQAHGARPPRSEHGDRPPREDRGDRPPREDRGDRPPRQAQGDRPPRGDRGERGERGGRGRDRGGRGDRGEHGGNDEQTARLSEAALAEVDSAISQLRSEPGLDEVTLKPQNSFYRRIQHQKAIESGFHSFSVGDGNERSVKVARKD